MLSKTFKTPKELDLSQEVYDALVAVYWLLTDEKIPESLFAMCTIGAPRLRGSRACGSAGCIMGWCNAITPGVLKQEDWGGINPTGLNELCFDDKTITRDHVTRAQGAQAIHNYLTTGYANWWKVLAD